MLVVGVLDGATGRGNPAATCTASGGPCEHLGVINVVLHAAVVPAAYPTVVITAEPKDGDPAVNGPEVVRSAG